MSTVVGYALIVLGVVKLVLPELYKAGFWDTMWWLFSGVSYIALGLWSAGLL